MSNVEQDRAAQVSAMSDEQLIAIWQSATDEETENLSPWLAMVVEEMGRRKIAL
ncbi:hypothetical protein [Novosphingobium sp. AP12]|uniref:hypothetical protein n=1 Tax=Novosphingobium sp. AP12 TaxID=1144305 RepID=UPI000271D94E|nr:hypothetical protein [Novosphingobium sp. AP12]EJL22059.1 hypothetical protein PMI02_04846 [Novosphingobium sp. AP12]